MRAIDRSKAGSTKERLLLGCAAALTLASRLFAGVPAESFQDLRWRNIGPLRAGWSLCAAGVPDALDTFYFGAADGGVWKTNDAGLTWKSIADQAPFSSVADLAVVPRAGARPLIYAATGQTHTRYDVMAGTGVYKTEDDGRTWTALGLADTLHIGRLWVDPRDANVVLVAALGHLYGPHTERGVFRTADGGGTWTKVAFVDENTGAVDLAADPGWPDAVYASFWQVRRPPWQGYHVPQAGPGSGIWKSADGGKTWAPASRRGLPAGPLGRIALAVAPGTKGQRVYAAVNAAQGSGLYRSEDGGENWALQRADNSIVNNYFTRLFADPRDPQIVYFMGQSFRRSTDGGKTIEYLKGSPGGDDYHSLWINPKHPERLILASDQGTTVSVNGGETWTPWYNQPTGQFYRLGVDDRFPYWVYSGQQDNGTVAAASRSDYGQLTFRDWHPVGGDERDGDLPDPEDPDIVYGSGLGGRLSRWDARTGRVANVSPWPLSSYGQRPPDARYRTTWITPIAISPRPPHALFWGTQFLFRSLDKGANWERLSGDLTGAIEGQKGCEGEPPIERATACGYGVIFAIAPSPAADGLIWIGTDNGRVRLTRDNGKTWNDVTPKDLPDWSQVAQIDASPSDPATAYVAVDRHRLDDRDPYIWVTHDFGASWRRADRGIAPGSYVDVVRQDPARLGLLYAGTRTGVYVSFDDGENWQPLQLNLPRTGINDLLVKGKDLVIATQGRALWILDDITPLRHLEEKMPAKAFLVPPSPAVRLAGNENRDTPLPPEFPTTENPPAGALIDYVLPETPQGEVTIEIFDDKKALVRAFSSADKPRRPAARQYFHDRWIRPLPVPGKRPGHNRFAWDLRTPRPAATDYDFSIAATPYEDTPVLPLGPFVLPGAYTVRLSFGGETTERPLQVLADPRREVPRQALEEQSALQQKTIQALAETVETLRLAGALEERAAAAPKKEAAQAMRARADLAPLLGGGGELDLNAIGAALSTLETDLEAADGPPTGPQRQVFAEYRARLDRALAAWKKIRAAAGWSFGNARPERAELR